MSTTTLAEDQTLSTVGTAAADLCYFAGCFPPSIAIGNMIPKGVGGPFTIGNACGEWKNAAATLQQIQQELEQLCTGLSTEAWSGDDRDGFDTEIKNLLAELGDSHNTAEAIGITLEVLVPIFPVWITESIGLATVLAGMAGAFYAAVASVVGDVTGVSEELFATGLELSETFLSIMNVSRGILIGVLTAAAATIGTAVGVDIKVQEDHGNTAALGDLGQAAVDGLGQDILNAAEFGASRALDKKGEGGIEHSDPPGMSPSAETAWRRGQEQIENLGNRMKYQGIDKGMEIGVEATHLPADLQKLINYGLDRDAPEPTDLEEVSEQATAGAENGSGEDEGGTESGEH